MRVPHHALIIQIYICSASIMNIVSRFDSHHLSTANVSRFFSARETQNFLEIYTRAQSQENPARLGTN